MVCLVGVPSSSLAVLPWALLNVPMPAGASGICVLRKGTNSLAPFISTGRAALGWLLRFRCLMLQSLSAFVGSRTKTPGRPVPV